MVTNHHESSEGEEDHQYMEEREPPSNPSSPRARLDKNLVEELMAIVESVKSIGEYRRTQKKECQNLVRRLKLFLPLLEELRDVDPATIPDEGIRCLRRLRRAFLSAKKFLKLCHGGSKIFLALEGEAMMARFHTVCDRMTQALDDMPYGQLGISEEEKEQVELLGAQLKRAKRRTDTQDMELAMDLMVVLSTNNDRNADIASVERLAHKLSLRTPEELRKETLAIRKLVKERKSQEAESTQQIIDLLNKLKRLAGVAENGILDDPDVPKTLTKCMRKCMSIAIPNEFLCPITLEIMSDPVIVATGQTYERESIQHWLDCGHQTCPKTGQVLSHLSLAPNFALKNLLVQWCEKNKFELPKKAATGDAEALSKADDGKILSLVQNLSSSKLDEQKAAVKKIRLLSKENPENRTLIANAGGIPLLVQLLSYPDSKIQEHAVTALLNLSIDESNKELISNTEPIPAIIDILKTGTIGAKENSAAALFSLSMINENKVQIGSLNGIPPLIELLRTGTIRGKKDAVTALFNICMNPVNKTMAIEDGIVAPLLKILDDEKLDMVNETLSILLILASCSEGRRELGKLPFIESLVSLIRDGTPKNQECATAVLLELCSNNGNLILVALQYGVYEPLFEISRNGTERGQRKANSLIKLMSKAEQIP